MVGCPVASYMGLREDRDRLRLYCRYPQGLTQDQWRELIAYHSQLDFLDPVPLTRNR
jgi:hypothetical protein